MRHAYTATQVRDAELPLLEAGAPLMARAAFALYQSVVAELRERRGALAGSRAAFLVGTGNNGGDALFAAAHLALRPVGVDVVLVGERAHESGLTAVRGTNARVHVLTESNVEGLVALCLRADVLVDGVLGIGADAPARGRAGAFVGALSARLEETWLAVESPEETQLEVPRGLNLTAPRIVAVDLPSGIDATRGAISVGAGLLGSSAAAPAILRADTTVTFGALKVGLVVPPSSELAGRVHVVDLGLDLGEPVCSVIEPSDFSSGLLRALVARPSSSAHKYVRGVVGIEAGSAQYPGAGILATRAALACGPGMVRYLGERVVFDALVPAAPEAVPAHGRVQSHLIGSGMEPGDALRARLIDLLAREVPVVVDAGALALITSELAGLLGPRHVLTPHAGELAGLLSALGEHVTRADVEASPLAHARRAHDLTGATVVAKGPATIVAGPERTYVASSGTPRLATAGSGDVLAGILAACLALASADAEAGGRTLDGDDWALAAAGAAYLHGRAGTIAAGECSGRGGRADEPQSRPIRASDIIETIPAVCSELGAPAASAAANKSEVHNG